MAAAPATLRASARTLRPLLGGLRARGVSVAELLAEVNLTPAVLEDPDARVPASSLHALWRRAEAVSGDPNFGLNLRTLVQPGTFDVVDYLCRNAATVGDGLRQYCRLTRLLHDGIVASVHEDGDVFRLEHVLSDGTILPRHYAEFIIGALVVIVRQASGRDIVPVRVHFLHPRPADTKTHAEAFGCPVSFDADVNGFELRRTDFELPLVQAQPELYRVLEQHAKHLLEANPRPSTLIAQVRSAIVRDLRRGTVTAASVARDIGVSERTLRRHLDAEGTTYQRILSELRAELAGRYMQERHLSIDDVAVLIGFSDRSAFYRAFRQWTGKSPTEVRAAQRVRASTDA